MHTDPISDMLTRIRNAQAVSKPEVLMPFSKIKFAILEVLAREGLILRVEKVLAHSVKLSRTSRKRDQISSRFDQIKVLLKYDGKRPIITSLKRVSKPGRRVYVGKQEIPVVLNNLGIAILSTPQGILTNKDARNKGVGGEVLCEIY